MNGKNYSPVAVLKLTVKNHFNFEELNATQRRRMGLLKKEARTNSFEVRIS